MAEENGCGVIYVVGAWITGVIAFIAGWIYAVASYGFFIGVGLGWIPALIIAFIAAFLWPLIALVILIIAYLLWKK